MKQPERFLGNKPVLGAALVSHPQSQLKQQPAPKTKFPQVYLDAYFATEKTVEKHLKESKRSNDLIKSDEWVSVLTGGFYGVKLNVTEWRIIQALLNYLTDHPDIAINGNIELSGFSELCLAAGLKKKKTRRGKMEFDGREVQHLIENFWRLAAKLQQILYKKFIPPSGGSKPKYDVFITQAALYQVGYLYQDVEGDKLRYVAATSGKTLDSITPQKIIIKLHPILVVEYHRYFRMIPRDPYHEIRGVIPDNQRVQSHQLNFLYWLHRHRLRQEVVPTNKRSLGEQIGLGYLIRARRWKELERVISSDYRLAKRLGYLLDYKQNVPTQRGGVKDVLTLNTEMITHAKPGKPSNEK